jgi:copper chaperone CopZ
MPALRDLRNRLAGLILLGLLGTTAVAWADEPEAGKSSAVPAPAALPAADVAALNRPYRVLMRLSGSSCHACLKELEKKVKGIDGVLKIKVDYPGDSLYQAVPGASWALATIDYVPARAPVATIKQVMKTQGYHPFKTIDKGPL